MEGLAWLHILDAEAYKRVRIVGTPEVMKARTDSHLLFHSYVNAQYGLMVTKLFPMLTGR